jgi:hypothetical protein
MIFLQYLATFHAAGSSPRCLGLSLAVSKRRAPPALLVIGCTESESTLHSSFADYFEEKICVPSAISLGSENLVRKKIGGLQ